MVETWTAAWNTGWQSHYSIHVNSAQDEITVVTRHPPRANFHRLSPRRRKLSLCTLLSTRSNFPLCLWCLCGHGAAWLWVKSHSDSPANGPFGLRSLDTELCPVKVPSAPPLPQFCGLSMFYFLYIFSISCSTPTWWILLLSRFQFRCYFYQEASLFWVMCLWHEFSDIYFPFTSKI